MSKVHDLQNILINFDELGRPRSEFERVFEGLRETIVEHLWKVFAYHKVRQHDINGWLNSLNKHLPRLRKFNKMKGNPKKLNQEFDYFKDKLIDEDFESIIDLQLISNQFSDKGYPPIQVNQKDLEKIHALTLEYINLILLDSGLFQPKIDQLR